MPICSIIAYLLNCYKLTKVETQCLASLLLDQKTADRDAKHCVSTLGLVIQIRILKTVNGYIYINNSCYALVAPDQVGDRRFATFRRKVASAVADDKVD
ncbi:MAG: hypothetical protein LBB88_07400 [Planctomycetaceae bacterium]|nr:hypothetical protein [Planctomycetaceae bacterium]